MDLKSDVFIDPIILLSYGLVELNLDSSDIFELPEEISKNSENVDGESVFLSENKISKTSDINEECTLKVSVTEDKSFISELTFEVHSRPSQKKDINGNEEASLSENLNELFHKLDLKDPDNDKVEHHDCEKGQVELLHSDKQQELSDSDSSRAELYDYDKVQVEPHDANGKVELSDSDSSKAEFHDSDVKAEFSDSDNEVNEDGLKLTERSPVKRQSRSKQNRDQLDILFNNKCPDRSELNPEKLKFLSGSSQVNVNEPTTLDQVTVYTVQDYFCGDYRTKTVNSPESGYESSCSPPLPHLSKSFNLRDNERLFESDDEKILDFIVKNTDEYALGSNNISSCNSEDKNDKINKIINYLKDTPSKSDESIFNVTFLNDSQECVPLVSETLQVIPKYLPAPHPISKISETPKKLVYKLNDKAKKALREFLSGDEFYAAKEKIYRKINEAKNFEDIKVIHVEDENGKASENRTNLHYAVLDSKIEDIYCLVEIHKQYNKPLTDINIRDKYGKTALDYAVQKEMTLVVDYLKENTACQSVNLQE